MKVVLASIGNHKEVTCSRHVKLVADCLLSEIEHKLTFNAIVLPGGAKGAESFANVFIYFYFLFTSFYIVL